MQTWALGRAMRGTADGSIRQFILLNLNIQSLTFPLSFWGVCTYAFDVSPSNAKHWEMAQIWSHLSFALFYLKYLYFENEIRDYLIFLKRHSVQFMRINQPTCAQNRADAAVGTWGRKGAFRLAWTTTLVMGAERKWLPVWTRTSSCAPPKSACGSFPVIKCIRESHNYSFWLKVDVNMFVSYLTKLASRPLF